MPTPEPQLFRRPDSPFWQVRLTLPSGKRIRKSTGRINLNSAQEWTALAQRHIARCLTNGTLFPFSK